MKNNKKNKKSTFILKIDKNENIVKETFKVKRNKRYKLEIEKDIYDIEVEDEKRCILEEDLSFKIKKYGETKVFFTNRETKEFSYVTLKVNNPFALIFIPIFILGIPVGYHYIPQNEINNNIPNLEDYEDILSGNENETEKNGVILFPSSVTNIGISDASPFFNFENSNYNRVFFHYYVYVEDTGETIDIGQVPPGKILKVDMREYFDKGTTNIRVDIRTFKDTNETKERNSMSFNSIVIYK